MNKFKIKMTVEYEIEYPDDFDESMVDFHLTESSWCADNALEDIQKYLKSIGRCLCGIAEFEVEQI
jgi:hypothetical protein